MDPRALIAPSSPFGSPAPFWFVQLFKVLGFALHTVPMNLWYAGMILCVLMHWRGGEHARLLASRLVNQMPVIVALGVNLGIVPLLFTQVGYYKVFYPATILMAWPWFSIFGLLTVAYYGVYIYLVGLRRESPMTPLRRAAGWASAVLFIAIGFLFANGFSLMVNLRAWPSLWQKTSAAGAPMGTALNTGDVSLLPRWLMMFGLALTTTAAYILVDGAFFAGEESEQYRRWAGGFALKLYTVGLAWFAAAGSWYIFGAWSAELRRHMLSGPPGILTLLTALGPGLPWLLIIVQRRGPSRTLSLLTGLAQFGVLSLNAFSRQIVQNLELARFLDISAEKVNMQLSPMIVFLALLVAGLAVVVWMVSKAAQSERQVDIAEPRLAPRL
jgi:hypothetical protein